jgi:hypothetical protein
MNLDPNTKLAFASQHAFAHVATGLVLASGVLTAAVALAGCSDSPPSGCANTGTCALPDARDAQTPADGFAETAADASDAASPDGGVADDGPTPDGGAADGPTPMPDGGVADGLAPDGGDALDANPCDPSRDPKDQPCLVTSAYGVFVAASGRNGASGDKTDPAISIAQGIATAAATGKSRVFICQGSYAETVVLDAAHDGISLYGGFDCINGWTWTGAATAVASPVGAPYALYVFSTTRPVAIEDLRFTSADASGQSPSGSGNSSMAAFFFASTARLARVALIAGRATDGAPGNPGVDTPNYPPALPTEAPGSAAYDALVDNDPSAVHTAPGGSVNNACADFSSSTGGAGGTGNSFPIWYPGAAGSASPPPASPNAPFDGAGGTNIGPGDPGADGAAHQVPVATGGFGSLSAAGWQAAAGADGLDGDPGQGGGGGGGNPFAYAGNGGGAGGCGGAGGKGGAGGGASIALLSVGSTLTLAACTLTNARAGDGGAGGDAQDGQGGGAGGATVNSALGGSGGNGAGGSGGSGGAAGISVGIAYQGGQPAIDAMTTITLGAPGLPGSPGAPGAHGIGALPTGNDGASGTQGVPGFAATVIGL